MFRWCSYCQTFIGESKPFDDFSLTHGVCKSCKDAVIQRHYEPSEDTFLIKGFFEELQQQLGKGSRIDKSWVLAEAKRLKIDPADLLAGVMQPLLYEIGIKFEKGEITVIQEHQFSIFIKELIHSLKEEDKVSRKDDGKCDVLLACADGNYHEFGLSIIEFKLKKLGVSVEALIPGAPSEQLFEYAKDKNACIIGLSISLAEQLPGVEQLGRLCQSHPSYRPEIFVGGYVIRNIAIDIPGITFHKSDINQLVENIVTVLHNKKKLA